MPADVNSITLYQRPDCPFCWKVRLAAFESGVNVSEIEVQLDKKHPDVVRLNPNETVPVLLDDHLVINESSEIIEYLIDQAPHMELMPGPAKIRAIIRQLHHYSDHQLGKILFPYIKEKRDSENCTVRDELKESTKHAWYKAQSMLSEKLGERDFFADEFSVAECALLPRFCLAVTHGLPIAEQFQNLKKWYARCADRPSFKKAMPQYFPGLAQH